MPWMPLRAGCARQTIRTSYPLRTLWSGNELDVVDLVLKALNIRVKGLPRGLGEGGEGQEDKGNEILHCSFYSLDLHHVMLK